MKSKEAISKRLLTLRRRYTNQHVKATQARCHRNCTFNHEQPALKPLQYSRNGSPETEFERAPRKNVTLVVMQDQVPARLCMFGAEDPSTWSGDICDNDEISKSCPKFRPKVSEEDARQQFMDQLADDEYVYENFRDIAALQWVLDERVSEKPLGFFERIGLWFKRKDSLIPPEKQLPMPDLPDNLWDDGEAR